MNKEKAQQAAIILQDLEAWEEKRKDFFLYAPTFMHDNSLTVYKCYTDGGHIILPTGQKIFLNPDELRVALEAIKTMIHTRMAMLSNDLEKL